MSGYTGKFLIVDLTTKTTSTYEYPKEWQNLYVGGRGFAVKYLWENISPGTDPLGPDNQLVFSIGPLSGLSLPSSSKFIVAAKSPLTGGYGDGNIGTRASPQLKKAGYDAVVFKGKATAPTYVLIDNDSISFYDASDLWGKGTFATETELVEKYGKTAGYLSIGQAGENLVKYATVRSQEGRSGGRPGMGAVMGSKNLKAVIVKGSNDFPIADEPAYKARGKEGYAFLKKTPMYEHWMEQGTTMVLSWCDETSSLPTRNYTEAKFEEQAGINGDKLHELTSSRAGCPNCNMRCGLIIKDQEGHDSELDYENIGMLGSNLGIGDLKKVGSLNYMADDYGLDTISLGSVLGFTAEAAQKGAVDLDFAWGDWKKAETLTTKLALRDGELANMMAEGTKIMSERIGSGAYGDATNWAIQVKGLECSAYNAFTLPGMALSFGTSPIGAHHKDAWVISWEISESDRDAYSPDKADKVIELQRIRGGMFESLVTCRFPWIELGYDLEEYPKYLKDVTGSDHWSVDKLFKVSDRIYALMRAFWIREFNAIGMEWNRTLDYPPKRWFEETLAGTGPYVGKNLQRAKYDELLDYYYDKRGWAHTGIPTKAKLHELNLDDVTDTLTKIVAVE